MSATKKSVKLDDGRTAVFEVETVDGEQRSRLVEIEPAAPAKEKETAKDKKEPGKAEESKK